MVAGIKTTKAREQRDMKTLLNLAVLVAGIANIAIGYFIIWQWASWPEGAAVIMAVGAINAWLGYKDLRRPKVVKYRLYRNAAA